MKGVDNLLLESFDGCLSVDAEDHCSLSSPSLCIAGHLLQYS